MPVSFRWLSMPTYSMLDFVFLSLVISWKGTFWGRLSNTYYESLFFFMKLFKTYWGQFAITRYDSPLGLFSFFCYHFIEVSSTKHLLDLAKILFTRNDIYLWGLWIIELWEWLSADNPRVEVTVWCTRLIWKIGHCFCNRVIGTF